MERLLEQRHLGLHAAHAGPPAVHRPRRKGLPLPQSVPRCLAWPGSLTPAGSPRFVRPLCLPAPPDVDEGWLKARNASGGIVSDDDKFPEGMKAFGDWVHSQVAACSPRLPLGLSAQLCPPRARCVPMCLVSHWFAPRPTPTHPCRRMLLENISNTDCVRCSLALCASGKRRRATALTLSFPSTLDTCRGTCQCSTPWYHGPGSQGYEKQDAQYMVDAGADYVKEVGRCHGRRRSMTRHQPVNPAASHSRHTGLLLRQPGS